MNQGPIFAFFQLFVSVSKKLNLVEYVKEITFRLLRFLGLERSERFSKSIGIDVYIALKWITVACLWAIGSGSVLATFLCAYLLWSNLFTYFYYHVWDTRFHSNADWQRRRFVSLIQSIAYNIFGFAFLYRFQFQTEFSWKFADSIVPLRESFLPLAMSSLSLFGSTSSVAEPISLAGLTVLSIQSLSTLIFLTIILGNTQIQKES